MSETVNIRVFQGNLRGRKTTTKSGGPLFSFMGIPYARPPIGALRFQLPSGQNTLLKPVMVWIHGGGFTHGSGNPDIYGPDYLVDRDVVLVTINYRVGVLGFLSLDNKAVPGNMGLKDQVAALHWVKENIASFGGDPNNVTIFGESAGGASVHYLMLSPLSKGLFHKVIAQSGCALNPWAFSLKNTARAFQLGQILGCKTNDPAELLNFLMKKDARQLVEVSHKLIHWSENLAGIKFPFVPTLEPNLPGAFMSEHPLHSLRTGHFHKVPFMIGRTTHEGIIMLRDMKENLWSKMNANFEKQFPEKLTNISYNIPTSIIAAKIRNFYFNNKPISENSVAEYVDFQTDLSFAEGIHTTLKLSTAQSNNPVYFYVFGFDGELGFAKQFSNSNIKGTCHADELGYLFRSHLIDIDVEPSSPEMKTINRMVSLWTNFAKTGNPTPYLSEHTPVIWKPCTNENVFYLNIDKEITMEKLIDVKREGFWEEMYRSKL
ncbi:Carboxylic ester hydrolase [Gryllus bimaculatus]|nr:Carboxylic ester hydrolase [Gryllus bimaculatus]